MTIKIAARRYSSTFKTLKQFVEEDHITIKPEKGKSVIVLRPSASDYYLLGDNYNEEGCTVNGTTYTTKEALKNAGYYIINNIYKGYHVMDNYFNYYPYTETDNKYIQYNYLYQDENLHSDGILISSTKPDKTKVYGLDSFYGKQGFRCLGSRGDILVCSLEKEPSTYSGADNQNFENGVLSFYIEISNNDIIDDLKLYIWDDSVSDYVELSYTYTFEQESSKIKVIFTGNIPETLPYIDRVSFTVKETYVFIADLPYTLQDTPESVEIYYNGSLIDDNYDDFVNLIELDNTIITLYIQKIDDNGYEYYVKTDANVEFIKTADNRIQCKYDRDIGLSEHDSISIVGRVSVYNKTYYYYNDIDECNEFWSDIEPEPPTYGYIYDALNNRLVDVVYNDDEETIEVPDV